MKILLIGDSFAADWSVKYNMYKGWPNLLADTYDVTNLAQAGVSEYKIYKQLDKVLWIGEYKLVIVSHTSPYRVPTRSHPVHHNDLLHNNADLMLNDITYHSNKLYNFFNRSLRSASGFFKYHYDVEFYETTYKLYRKAIEDRLGMTKFISLNMFPNSEHKCTIDLSNLATTHTGKINHMSEEGNRLVYEKLLEKIKEIYGSST